MLRWLDGVDDGEIWIKALLLLTGQTVATLTHYYNSMSGFLPVASELEWGYVFSYDGRGAEHNYKQSNLSFC